VERQLRAVEIQRNPAEIPAGQISYEERKSQKRAERKRKRLIEKYENQIAQFEDKIEEIRKKMEIPEINSNPTKLQVLMKEMSELRYELNVTYDLWAESQES
jgi:ATP-binding cassette subfamily F protein 3